MADFDPNAPATKGDVIALKDDVSAVKGDVIALKGELRGDMVALEERLTETLRDVQTELLKAFYSFATSAEARFKDAETSDIALRQRLSAVEARVTEVEKRLNFPPAA
jgi:BMFP domain-containing protein YqiC